MVRHSLALIRIGLGRADVHAVVQRHGIQGHDFRPETLGQRDAELAFAGTATILNWIFLGAHISAVQLAGFFLLWVAILNLEKKDAGVGLPQSD